MTVVVVRAWSTPRIQSRFLRVAPLISEIERRQRRRHEPQQQQQHGWYRPARYGPDDYNDDDDDDDEPPDVDIRHFSPPTSSSSSMETLSFGYNKGRSSPNQRKAMGRSASSVAHVHLCTNCGSEFVQWRGRCPTCRQWNTLQEHAVLRQPAQEPFGATAAAASSGGGAGRPIFPGATTGPRPQSWLDGILFQSTSTSSSSSLLSQGRPVRVTDLYQEAQQEREQANNNSNNNHQDGRPNRHRRIVVPNDDELNTVLGGGIMPGSLILVGGDPGVGKSTLLLQTAGAIATHLSQPTLQIGMGLPAATVPTTPTAASALANTTTFQQLQTQSQQPSLGPVWYCSGEESPYQIASRAERLGIQSSELYLFSETHVDSLCAQVVQQIHQYHHDSSRLRRQQQQQEAETKRKQQRRKQQQQQKLRNKNKPPTKRSKTQAIEEEEQDADDFWEYHDDENENDAGEEEDLIDDDDDQSSFSLPASQPPSLLIIDSIQTMVCTAGGASSAGGVTQVRECVALLLRLAKSTGIPIVLVGHVTKSGDVAGPRTVEHMVDSVLYLEGSYSSSSSNNHRIRFLRASKNRFGSNDEVGMYEMIMTSTGGGRLVPVSDPSSLFLSQQRLNHNNNGEGDDEDAEGCAIAIVLEGMRAMAVEVQALVTYIGGGGNNGGSGSNGRRTVQGMAPSRLMLLLGVLQKRCHMSSNLARSHDIYVNVAGGGSVGGDNHNHNNNNGHAADLATALALVSSHYQIPIRADTAFVGEVGLLGELRPVPSMEKRFQEAQRLGFSRIVSPPSPSSSFHNHNHWKKKKTTTSHQQEGKSSSSSSPVYGMEWIQCRRLVDALDAGLVEPMPQPPSSKRRSTARSDPSKSENNKSNKNIGTSNGNQNNNDRLLSGLGLDDIFVKDNNNKDIDDPFHHDSPEDDSSGSEGAFM